jgi:FkbM family methyltransferase
VFYRIPNNWFCFEAIVRFRGSKLIIWVGENIGRKIYFLNDFEGEQLDIFSNLVSNKTIFYDIGANIGVYSLVAGSKGAKIFAFEPSPDVLPYLKKNIDLNDYDITLVPEAVGDKHGEIPFYFSTKENMGVGRIMEYGKRTNLSIPPIKVPMNTLDYYVGHFPAPTFIKMDIEGAELFAIEGGKELFRRQDAPMLMVEFHPGEIKHLGGDANQLMGVLRGYGYRQYQHFSAKEERWYIFSKQDFLIPGFAEVTS